LHEAISSISLIGSVSRKNDVQTLFFLSGICISYHSLAILYKAFTVFQLRVVTDTPSFRSKNPLLSFVFP